MTSFHEASQSLNDLEPFLAEESPDLVVWRTTERRHLPMRRATERRHILGLIENHSQLMVYLEPSSILRRVMRLADVPDPWAVRDDGLVSIHSPNIRWPSHHFPESREDEDFEDDDDDDEEWDPDRDPDNEDNR